MFSRVLKGAPPPPASVLDLPLDVQHRIIGHLDWRSLPNAAATCRTWATLVHQQNQSAACGHEWSHAMFKGEPSEAIEDEDSSSHNGGETGPNGTGAWQFVEYLLSSSRYLAKSTRPDVVVVTATPSWQPHLQDITDALISHLPNRKSVHVICCVAVGIIGTDEEGQVHEVEDGSLEAEAIAVALLHLGANQRVFSVSETNTSARQKRKDRGNDMRIDDTLDQIAAFAQANAPTCGTGVSCPCCPERGIFSFLVGDNVYDVSDLKTKIESKFRNIHMMGGLCGYDTRKQAVYYSSPESRALEEKGSEYPLGNVGGAASAMDVDSQTPRNSHDGTMASPSSSTAASPSSQGLRSPHGGKGPRVSAAALFICNQRTTRASYRGIKQLMSDFEVDKMEGDEDGTKVFSLRKRMEGGSSIRSAALPMYQVLRELELKHGSLHGVTFGVKRKIPVSVDSGDPCLNLVEGNAGGAGAMAPRDLKTRVESVDIVRGVWDPDASDRLEAIVVPVEVKPGDICSFYTYSADESLKELEEILKTLDSGSAAASGSGAMQQQQQQQKAPSSCFGGFLIICNARGSYLHSGLPDVETKVISKNLPNVSLIGFFANGEVGPMPFREWSLTKYFQAQEQNPDSQLFGKNPQFNNTVLQGNTSVLAIARI